MNKQKNIIPISIIFARGLAGFMAGFAGTIVMGIILMLTWSIVGDVLTQTIVSPNEFGGINQAPPTHPLFLSFVTLSIFGATLTASLVFTFLITVMDEKYSLRETSLAQVFIGNLIILFLMLPVYLIFSAMFKTEGIALAGLFHCLITTIFTFFVIELLNAKEKIFINLYGILIGLCLFAFLASLFGKNSTILAFMVLPLLLTCVGAGNGLAEVFYNWFYRTYGVDFLNLSTKFGEDRKE